MRFSLFNFCLSWIKWLIKCHLILQTVEDFTAGNYYEVIYCTLQKSIVDKGRRVTQALFACFLEFLKVVPLDVKVIHTIIL